MKLNIVLLLTLLLGSVSVWAEDGDCGQLSECMTAPVNPHDTASLQRGARLFVNYCLGCHTAKYVRYERVADDLGIDHKMMLANMEWTSDKIGDHMVSGGRPEEQAKWFGNAPPDLTLETRLRSPDWVYSYLLNFYPDVKRPWGVNNRVFKDVAMPNALETLHVELGDEGFKSAVGDLVNYMAYMAEPIKLEREHIGWWVWGFLAILFIPVYLLNKEYWKDVK